MCQLFILGDSISIHYGPHLEQMLKKHFIYARKEGLNEALKNLDYPAGTNGGDSSMVRAYLQERFAESDVTPTAITCISLNTCGNYKRPLSPVIYGKFHPKPSSVK